MRKLFQLQLIKIKMETTKASTPSRDTFVKALSNYSECIRPFLRVAQERYIASYYAVEG